MHRVPPHSFPIVRVFNASIIIVVIVVVRWLVSAFRPISSVGVSVIVLGEIVRRVVWSISIITILLVIVTIVVSSIVEIPIIVAPSWVCSVVIVFLLDVSAVSNSNIILVSIKVVCWNLVEV